MASTTGLAIHSLGAGIPKVGLFSRSLLLADLTYS